MPTTIDAYSASEDFLFRGEKFQVVMSFGCVHVRLGSRDCLWGRLEEGDRVRWTDVFSHPHVEGAAEETVREMLRWSREQKARAIAQRKYGCAA